MSQDHYRDLIERIVHRCQQTAWDAQHLERKQRWLVDPEEDYDGCYIPVRNSFITLKKGTHAWEPSLAFPPATEHRLRETEQELGFSLPPLLRLCYTQVANGGFGPGYGIIGVLGGFPHMDGLGEDIAQGYQQCLHASTPIRLEEYEMKTWAEWGEAADPFPDNDLEEETKLRTTGNDKADPNGERIYLYEFPSGVWPEHLLPFCYWGCGICTCIDASTEHMFQCAGYGQVYILRYVAASLEEWLERWLAGEDLQFL